ncbi:MAG: desulfoferrodoxin [Deltaproteobacteria bacterium]|nr:desulfoferrodoxin [Deltaproteobacteria bacterium]
MAIEKLQTYKCSVCGNIVEVLHVGGGTLVCCDKEMVLLEENTQEAAVEKHVPVVEQVDGGYKVSVGSVAHPMEEQHFIEWIELIADGKSYTAFLSPGATPQSVFAIDAAEVTARAYCNLHGLWKSE